MTFTPGGQRNNYGFYSENYHSWAREQLDKLTEEQLAKLPIQLSIKLRKGSEYALTMLTDDQLKYVLYVACNKLSILIFEDNEAGMGIKEWNEMNRTYRGKATVASMVDQCRIHGMFFLGNHDLMKYLSYVNFVHSTNLYKLAADFEKIPRGRNKLGGKVKKVEDALMVMWNMLIHMEGNRKRMMIDYGISQPEWYALIFYSYYKEATSASFYNDHFAYANASNKTNLKVALTSLRRKGYLDFRGGNKRYTKYYITAAGQEIANKILERIVLP